MYDTIDTASAPSLNSILFGADSVDRLREAHGKVSHQGSRLFSARDLIANLCKTDGIELHLEEAIGRCTERYTIDYRDVTLTVTLSSFNHANTKAKRSVKFPESAKAFNDLLKDLQANWYTDGIAGTGPISDRFLSLSILLTKMFVVSSTDAAFDTDCDPEGGRWAIFFDDPRRSAQADLVITRRS